MTMLERIQSRPYTPYIALFCLALLARVLHLVFFTDSPIFSDYLGDARRYHLWALDIVQGKGSGPGVFFQAPFYPYFLATIYTLLGKSILAVRGVQILLDCCAVVLLAKGGGRLFTPAAGLVAGLIAALLPAALHFDIMIQKAALGFFLMSSAVYIIARLIDRPWKKWWFLLGLCFGCFILVRENVLLLAILLFVWLFVAFRHRAFTSRLLWAGLLVLGMSCTLLPTALRNYTVAGEFVLTTSQFGANLYTGNNPRATGIYEPLIKGQDAWQFESANAQKAAEQLAGRKLTASEASDFWVEKTLDYITDRPLHWLTLMGKKILMVFNRIEIGDTEDIYTHSRWSPILQGLLWILHFGVVFPLAAVGLFAARRNYKKLWIFYLMILAYAGSIALFFIFDRYRHPLTALLIPFAGAGCVHLAQLLGQAQWKQLGRAGVVLILAAVIANVPIVPKSLLQTTTLFNIGILQAGRGNPAEALTYYRESIAVDPDNTRARLFLGRMLREQGKLRAALEQFEQAGERDPAFYQAHHERAQAYSALGRTEQAKSAYLQLLEVNPNFIPALLELSTLFTAEGDYHKAAGLLDHAAELDPENLSIVLQAAKLHTLLGNMEKALNGYGKILEHNPDHTDALKDTAYLYIAAPNAKVFSPEKAIRYAERAVRLTDSQDLRALYILAAAYAYADRLQEAQTTAEKGTAEARNRGETEEEQRFTRLLDDIASGTGN